MKNGTLCLLLVGIFFFNQSGAQEKSSPKADSVFTMMMSGIKPSHVTWVKNAANLFNSKSLSAEYAGGMAWGYGVAVLGSMADDDIEALAFLVLMQAAKSAQEDLKSVMEGVKAINNAKAKQREMLDSLQKLSSKFNGKSGNEKIGLDARTATGKRTFNLDNHNSIVKTIDSLNRSGNWKLGWQAASYKLTSASTKADLEAMVDKAKADIDSMSEMGEMESLRLQMAMDRMSKMMSTLSNILKKISDTAQSITQNLK